MNGVYILEGSTVVGTVSSANSDNIHLWHIILGHISERWLNELVKQELLCGDKVHKLSFCENCILGKSRRIIFNTRTHMIQEILEYVLSDLLGPVRTPTMGGARYFMYVIDDYSRKVKIMLL